MAKRKSQSESMDSAFVLKVVLYMILGVQWIRFFPSADIAIPLPLGGIIGLVFAAHDHFRIDRKIEYAVLLIAMLVGFWLPIGINVALYN